MNHETRNRFDDGVCTLCGIEIDRHGYADGAPHNCWHGPYETEIVDTEVSCPHSIVVDGLVRLCWEQGGPPGSYTCETCPHRQG
jgi:hypothetical protein